MVENLINPDDKALKPFRLVKFFSITGVIVFFLSTLALSWVISNNAKKVSLQRSEAYALVISRNLSYQVITQFVVPIILRGEKIALRKQRQHDRLDAIVRNAIFGMNVQSVTIFDSEENIISYSTVPELIGKRDQGGREYELALTGEDNSSLISAGSILNLVPGSDEIFCQLKTYIPFPFRQNQEKDKNPGSIMGVIEIVQDLSDDLKAIVQLQAMIISTSVLIMSSLFAILWFIVVRADRMIEERAEERRRLEDKLNHAERLASLGKMVASVSHEIKNPLGIVRSTADILRKRMQSQWPENGHLAEIIIEETGRLDGIVREFLDFARPQVPQLARIQINEVLTKAMAFIKPELEKKGIRLVAKLGGGLQPCEADSELLYRAYLNILINSIQAMPEGGTLTVESFQLRGKRPFLFTAVHDTGTGMNAETKAQIFNPFFTQKNRGTGLGLAIVKNIVDSHHGIIEVESAEGEGTVFIIKLPLH